jgi:hypothetical protein
MPSGAAADVRVAIAIIRSAFADDGRRCATIRRRQISNSLPALLRSRTAPS